jgi:hypothetical protein
MGVHTDSEIERSWGFWFGHRKTSPSWGEVPFLCLEILEYQGLRLMQNAHLKKSSANGERLFKKCNWAACMMGSLSLT